MAGTEAGSEWSRRQNSRAVWLARCEKRELPRVRNTFSRITASKRPNSWHRPTARLSQGEFEALHRLLELRHRACKRQAQIALGAVVAEVAARRQRDMRAAHQVEAEVPTARGMRRAIGPGVERAVGHHRHREAKPVQGRHDEVAPGAELAAAALVL